jgi:NADH-quinone oxidoreductase subunit M
VAVQSVGLVLTLVALTRFSIGDAADMQLVAEASWIPELGVDFRLGVDGISMPLVVLTSLLGWCTAIYTVRHVPNPGRARSFVGLLLLLQVGMVGTFVVLDLVVFFIFFEIVLAPMWFLIAFWGTGRRRKAANTFIVYTVLGSVVMLVGFLIVIVSTGSSNMVAIASGLGADIPWGLQLAAALLILGGLAVKTPMWPLHTWLPDAHTAAPTVGCFSPASCSRWARTAWSESCFQGCRTLRWPSHRISARLASSEFFTVQPQVTVNPTSSA